MIAVRVLLWCLSVWLLTKILDWLIGWATTLKKPPEIKPVRPLDRK